MCIYIYTHIYNMYSILICKYNEYVYNYMFYTYARTRHNHYSTDDIYIY